MAIKKSYDERLVAERKLINAIRNKMDALSGNLKSLPKKDSAKNRNRGIRSLPKDTQHQIKRKHADGLKTEIILLLKANGLTPHRRDPMLKIASREERLAIRFDFDGILHRPFITDFSEAYINAKQTSAETAQQNQRSTLPEYPLWQYNLNASPIWRKMRQLENIKQLQRRLSKHLCKHKIPPAVIPEMNYHDFIDTIIDTCKETKNRPFEGMRSQHLKMFAHCYGAEFTNIMSRLDFKPEFIQKNLHAMRQGKSDNIFDLHHKTNITNFRELPNPHQINDFSNMLITFAYPHHRCMHFDKGFDIDKSVVFLGSFDPAFQIRRNIEREQRYLTMKTAAHAKSR